ncbi:uncharacterized protein A1O9_10543 [Exophiala aquamarina CBS 119918]|uniref:Uncharacterized protein n=1 Tax=Exophiala aquamarina CBS 119918 TaxID=1182545 RepID=A0A072P2S2_9EURO|nr:uncharacterized protein A1O9_10543 [Exophiala aquamarina CBS 119918]KEF53568.1 hypothetical protein A1O9_10543 [Exophiala aquamarina CBS 119918]
MENTQPWTQRFAEPAFNPASSSSHGVSSYFVRPNKVVKPSSRNNSPRTLKRRKTTTSAPSTTTRTRSFVDHLPTTTAAQQWPLANAARSRPVSWHPTSMDDFYTISYNTPPLVRSQALPAYDYSTTNVNGLITPLSHPVANEPQIQELITPLDEYPGHTSTYSGNSGLAEDQAWLLQSQQKCNPYSFNLPYQGNLLQSTWQPNQSQQPPSSLNVHTAASSPDCLPLHVDTLSLDTVDLEKGPSEELVGMGLYDSPADVQSTSLLFAGISNATRKGLILEESFVPEDRDDEELDEDALAEDDEDDEDQDEELETPFDGSRKMDYSSQSIANHMGFLTHQEPNSLATTYLATLGQLSSAYYPTAHPGYGWI